MKRLDYAPHAPRELWVAFAANIGLVYPLFPLGLLYGQWFLSWYMLGHAPRPDWDDPKFISGASWMHPVTTIALLGMFPAAGGALAFNTLHVVINRVRGIRLMLRIVGVPLLWLGTIALPRYHPMVLVWWLD
jgi:hypothetical protein